MYQDSTTISTCPRCVATCNTTDPFPFQKKIQYRRPPANSFLAPPGLQNTLPGEALDTYRSQREINGKKIHVNLLTFHQICASDNRTDTATLPLQGLHHGSNNSTRWHFVIRG